MIPRNDSVFFTVLSLFIAAFTVITDKMPNRPILNF